ncbi:hypothetical protein MATL_G00216830 [Megalops atlanticus]|uniref:PHD-type domain-containing protein n=1 Tax=Megalops atlanticus TaxID=7932 RepID=A0A9D3PJG5_MEGAT|nr:hypothetical protein MATL_G00216830 [Megalops atlanticus]
MQNFRNSSAPPTLPPGFSGGSGVAGGNSPYLPQSSGPQCSPRMTEEYAGVQPQQNLQTQNQHLHHLVPHHHTQASLMLSYGARNRGGASGEALHGSTHSGSNNPYRKDMMDHYFSMSGKERHRRGGQGLGYGTGFGYPNMDGHMSHQYRHAAAGSGSSGMMAHYQLDYSVPAGSGGSSSSSSSSSGTGAFSPSNQYSMTQNPSIQTPTGPTIHSRQQAQNYPSQQALHQGQQHRGYPGSGHRMPPQFSHYSSSSTSTGSQGMYNSPPLRYHGGSNSGSFECKVSSSTANSNPSSSIISTNSNTGPLDTAGQNYTSSGYPPYHSQPAHSHHKQPTHTHRGSQHNLGPSYDSSHKIHASSLLHQPPPGLPYPEHPPVSNSSTSSSTNPSVSHFSSQEKSKSPMHSQSQQSQLHQNFSPISNPSPVASTVQSPSCSSSPSPLMGMSESGNSTVPPTHPSLQKARNSHSHSRLLQTVTQLSPTPNSNSSISSCGSSSGNVNTAGLNSSPGSSHPVSIRSRMGMGIVGENSSSSLYPSSPLDKLMADSGINSLNALTSQVANLPNTVQHMLLSDTLLSHRAAKDAGYQGHLRETQMQQSSHAMHNSQQKSRGISAPLGGRAGREGIGTVGCGISNSEVGAGEEATQVPESPIGGKLEGEEQFSGGEGGRVRQMSGASSGSEPSGYYPVSHKQRTHAQSVTEQDSHNLPLQIEMGVSTQKGQTLTSPSGPCLRTTEHDTHSSFPKSPSSSSPSSHPPSALPSPNLPPSCPPASSVPTSSTPSPSLISSFHSNIVIEPVVSKQEKEERGDRSEKDDENEDSKEEWRSSTAQKDEAEVGYEGDRQRETGRQTEIHLHPSKGKENEEEKQDRTDSEDITKHAGGVGVIVSTRSEMAQPGTVAEQLQTAPSAPPCSLHQPHNAVNYAEETHSHSSFGESSSLNGEDSDSMCTYPSNYATKASHKSSSEQSPHTPSTDPQKIPYGTSELHHSSGMDFKNRGRGGMETNLKYQGYHQPQPNYNSGPRKSVGVTGMEEPGKRGNGLGISRGQENNSQPQQQFPSLLQEVLQGYHLDRRYGRMEHLAQKIPNSSSQPQSISHQSLSRHPYEMTGNTRPQVTQTGLGVDHQNLTQMAASGKLQNQSQLSGPVEGQDSSLHSWGSMGAGAKGEHCSSSDKLKIATTQRSTPSMPKPTESSARAPPKQINLADYFLPHRKPSSNLSAHHSAVQQILLQETEPMAGNGIPKGQPQPNASSSSLLTSAASSERRSVICDVSPSRRTTPERERDGDKEHMRGRQQTGSSVASVIQQSHPTSESESIKLEEREKREVEIEMASQTTKETPNLNANPASHSGNFPVKEAFSEHQNKSPHPSMDSNSDLHRSSSGKKGHTNSTSNTVCHPQQAIQHPSVNPSPVSSPSSRCQSYFQGLDGSSSRSPGLARYGFPDTGVGTSKAISYHPHYPTHPHHYIPSQSQLENPKATSKLQMYPHSHSLQLSHGLGDRGEWTASNSNRPENIMQSPSTSSSRHQQQSPARPRSHTSVLATQQPHHHQGSYYDTPKMWGLSEREDGGTLEAAGNCRRTQLSSTVSPGAATLPGAQTSDAKCLQSNPPRGVREEMVKPFHPMSASSPHSKSSSSSSSSAGGQQCHGPIKTGSSGDTNPLMMRRRVRSFISPIPAKRQHQDLSQQHQQRAASNQYSSSLPTSESKHQNDADSSSPNLSHTKLTMPNAAFSTSPPPAHGKTKILPPRKGRGLKLEAIVQKITPNVKKASNNNSSHTDSASNHHSGVSHAEITDCHPESQDQDTCGDGNFPRIGPGSGSCLPYMGEGLSMDEIMYYRGVEETGPLPPTAYPCDPHQEQHILKHDITGNITRGAAGDIEPDFGMGASVSPMTEREGVGERGKDELRLPSDFTLLGPLPPPPPLPCPVQPSSPPSSSALSDIQHFSNTYQQLETRRGEHSAANLLRQKLQESGMGLGMDDYPGSDYFGTQPPHHNQSAGPCLITRTPHAHQSYQQHLVPSARAASSMTGLPQLTEPKPPDNIVPKGYFPSGKKKGRPVGSVNKQKRAQVQTQHVSLNTPSITHAAAPTPTHTPAHIATPPTAPSTSATTETQTSPPADIKMSSTCVTPAVSQTVKADVEDQDVQPVTEVKSRRHRQSKAEDGSDGVGRRRRRRGVVGQVGKEELQRGTGIGGNFSVSGHFPDYKKSAFVPYIHVERKEEEIGAVCTIVNAEEERMKGESGGEGGTDKILNFTFSSQGTKGDREMEKVKEKEAEQVDSELLQSCTTGKALPSSGYVLSGAVMTESDNFGPLLCCLCKKWANYKNLGDLYGPYYPPEYTTKLTKNHTQIRQNLLTRVGNTGVNLGAVATESTQQDIQPIKTQTGNSMTETDSLGNQTSESASNIAQNTECLESRGEMHSFSDQIGHVSADMKMVQTWDMKQEPAITSEVLKQCRQQNDLEEKREQPQNQQWPTEDAQQRPQHRKLTSHPRFKRRHKSSEDLPKTTPTNSKALLPFQPPPQLLNQDTSDPLAQLAQLPQMPLDPEELWVHEGCIVWASGVYLVNGRLYGLKEALDGARDTCCSHCEVVGSTLGCYSKGCTLRYHYLCALEADCSLNEENFSLRCLKHKFPQNSGPVKSVYPEQSERG